jgi:hypothetical protein
MVVLVCSPVFTAVRIPYGKDSRTPAYGSGRVAGNWGYQHRPVMCSDTGRRTGHRSSLPRSARGGRFRSDSGAGAGLRPLITKLLTNQLVQSRSTADAGDHAPASGAYPPHRPIVDGMEAVEQRCLMLMRISRGPGRAWPPIGPQRCERAA